MKYPTISRSIKDIVGTNLVLEVENASQTFNNIVSNRQQMLRTGSFAFGYAQTAAGSSDTINLFKGTLTEVNYTEGAASFSFDNAFIRLNEKVVGAKDAPVSFINTVVNPADLAWWIVTSYGGLSLITSTSNPDIDYAAWTGWKNDFNTDSITVSAQFQGERILDIIVEVAKLTDSTAFDAGGNKLSFARWTGAASYSVIITDAHITDSPDCVLTTKEMFNRANVLLNYNPTSQSWGGQITAQDSTSVNTYGLMPVVYDGTLVWHVTSQTAINFAQRLVNRRSRPNLAMHVKTPLRFLDVTLGDEVILTSQVYSLNGNAFFIDGFDQDFESKTIAFSLNEGFGRGGGTPRGFTLDDAIYGLLDQTNNPLY